GVKAAARMKPASGFSGGESKVPRRTGGSASVGVSSRSNPLLPSAGCHHSATNRVVFSSQSSERSSAGAGRARASSASAQVSGSTSPAPMRSPVAALQPSRPSATPADHRLMKCGAQSGRSSAAGWATSTWWPSVSSTWAASWAATTHRGSTTASFPGAEVISPMRSRPGSAPTSSRQGRTGAGAVEEGGTVPHGPGEDVLADDEGVEAGVGPERRPAPGRLESHEPAGAGRDADRPAAVVGMGRRHEPRRRRRRRPAAGAAGGARPVPGVAGGTVGRRFGGGDDAELGGVRPPDRDQPRGPEAGRQERVALGPPLPVPEESHPLVERLAGLVTGDVLDEEGDAGEG